MYTGTSQVDCRPLEVCMPMSNNKICRDVHVVTMAVENARPMTCRVSWPVLSSPVSDCDILLISKGISEPLEKVRVDFGGFVDFHFLSLLA